MDIHSSDDKNDYAHNFDQNSTEIIVSKIFFSKFPQQTHVKLCIITRVSL